jgi:Helix-turn-helix domain
MSIAAIDFVFKHSKTKNHTTLIVALTLADFANNRGVAWPALSKIAEKSRLSVRSVCTVLGELERLGEIRRERSTGGATKRTMYFLALTTNDVQANYEAYSQLTMKHVHGSTMKHVHTNCEAGFTPTVKRASHALNRHKPSLKKTGDKSPEPFLNRRRTEPEQGEDFDRFYNAYPRKVGKADALKAWKKLNPNPKLVAEIVAGVKRYADTVQDSEAKYIKHPGPWLNSRRWEDEPTATGEPTRDIPDIKGYA